MLSFMEDLVDGYDMNSMEYPTYLDLHTGKVVRDDAAISGEEEIDWDDEENDERYQAFPEQDSREEYRWMEDFAHMVRDEKKKSALLKALSQKGPFRKFKDEVIHQGVREEWFAFHDIQVKALLLEWLLFKGISIHEMERLRQK